MESGDLVKKKVLLGTLVVLIVAIIGGMYWHKQHRDVSYNGNKSFKEAKKEYDVIVVGGEPEGVSAAISAARNGAKVLLVEKNDGLGGLMTYGYMNYLDIPQAEGGESTSQGIFMEWWKNMGKVNTVNVDKAKDMFLRMVDDEKNIDLLLSTKVKSVQKEGNKLTGITVDYDGKEKTFSGKRFIDSTADADLSVLAKVPYFVGRHDIHRKEMMAATMIIHLKGVDWEKVKYSAKTGVMGGASFTETALWGFGGVDAGYIEKSPRANLRGMNVGWTKSDDVYINALQIFGIDGTNPESIKEGFKIAKEETKSIIPYLQTHIPGFEKAELASYPNELYIRETRHIKAEEQLSIKDVWENRTHWNDIAMGGYSVDVQAVSKQVPGFVITDPNEYGIPFGSLVPKKIDNLLVASKASGYSSLAAGSARVIPTGMATAQAAGVASVMSIDKNMSFRDMTKNKDVIDELQRTLKKQGAYIHAHDASADHYPYKTDAEYPMIQDLATWGHIWSDYTNNLYLDQGIMKKYYLQNLRHILEVERPEGIDEVKKLQASLTDEQGKEMMTYEEAVAWFKHATGVEYQVKPDTYTRREFYHMVYQWLIESKGKQPTAEPTFHLDYATSPTAQVTQ